MSMEKSKLIILISSIIIVIAIIIVVVVLVVKHKKSEGTKEGFFHAANGAFVDKGMDSIIGYNIQTDQMTNRPASELLGDMEKDNYYADPGNLGAVYNKNNFNELLKNQMEISSIASRDTNQVLTNDQQREISKRLNTSMNNSQYNLFDRAGTKNVKFSIQPGATRAIIEGSAIPERDRNHNIEAVSRVIPVKAFQLDTNNITNEMIQTKHKHLSENKSNKKTDLDRKPSELAAKSAEVLYSTAKKLDPDVANNNSGLYTLTTGYAD